jgi:hypothetical protein
MSEKDESEILIIFNIPESFGSADLRRFFTDFVESERFIFFHFKRRPESKLPNFDRKQFFKEQSSSSSLSTSEPKSKFNCCPVNLSPTDATSFIARYNKTHWTDEEGVDLDFKCFIVKSFDESHWKGLDESKPPSSLPRGNVGTSTKFLLESIRNCKLPPTIIKKLKLNFHERRRRAYATMPLTYQEPKSHKSFYVPSTKTESKLPMPGTSKTAEPPNENSEPSSKNAKSSFKSEKTKVDSDAEDDRKPDSDEEEEEWDRHRSLHLDVSARREIAHPDDLEFQEGTKERRYEERMEVTWEKGGSGLVFWTDEQFWRETAHDDSDEADDWDVDLEGYEVEGGGDLDNRSAMDMHYNDDVREGRVVTSAFKKKRNKKQNSSFPIGDFEKHTLGVGRKLMERQGWKDGAGLGSKLAGISHPVTASGSANRAGLGYKGDGPPIFKKPKKRPHDCKESATKSGRTFHISTVFDEKCKHEESK